MLTCQLPRNTFLSLVKYLSESQHLHCQIIVFKCQCFNLKWTAIVFVSSRAWGTDVHYQRGANRYSIARNSGRIRSAPKAISSQSRPSKRDSNMTINDCNTSRAKETTDFSLCTRRGWHFNRAVPLPRKVISVQIICGCICALSCSAADSANQIMSQSHFLCYADWCTNINNDNSQICIAADKVF